MEFNSRPFPKPEPETAGVVEADGHYFPAASAAGPGKHSPQHRRPPGATPEPAPASFILAVTGGGWDVRHSFIYVLEE